MLEQSCMQLLLMQWCYWLLMLLHLKRLTATELRITQLMSTNIQCLFSYWGHLLQPAMMPCSNNFWDTSQLAKIAEKLKITKQKVVVVVVCHVTARSRYVSKDMWERLDYWTINCREHQDSRRQNSTEIINVYHHRSLQQQEMYMYMPQPNQCR